MTDKNHLLIAGLLLSAFLILSACSNSYVDDIDRGDSYKYRPGFPELRMASTVYINNDNKPILNITGELVKGSLIYANENDNYLARFTVEITIKENSDTGNILIRESFTDEISSETNDIVNSQAIYLFEDEFEVSPGELLVTVSLTDNQSSKQTLRQSTVTVPSPGTNTSAITNVSLLTKNSDLENEEFNQATTYDIPSRMDSLRFRFQAINRDQETGLNVEMRLMKFESDTSIARPMNYSDYSPASIQRIGIDYDEYDVVQSSVRNLTQPGNVIIEYNFHELERGNYRLEVSSGEGEDQIYKAIEFGIKSPNYPSIKTPKELARPLAYLMTEKEYEELMSIEDPAALKNAIDRFWLSNVQNSNKAREVISLYYERVEEANKQFSNFKEGWKTDTGMMYILFGPPMYVNTYTTQMVWSYSYNREDPESNFVFDRPKLKTKFYPFDNFILRRNNFYYNVQRRQIQRWLSGSILSRPF
ncbi:GWxTD domain-containing protein [Gracilimonas sp. Q87]|uniref:GWxTD domain-containing protein n=1 Tax=Gracilimonas sp. Q87 TaxID=3384766 RepID=UPI003984532D